VVDRLLIALSLLVVTSGLCASAFQQPGATGQAIRASTWTARTSSGRVFSGTYTVKVDAASGTVTGEWTLFGAGGLTAARGGWSAAKAAGGWNGAWRASIVGRGGEFAGTWTTRVDLPSDASLARLFERAAEQVVNGTWQAGRQSGTWSINASN
jgi:hypothetical protein